MNLRGKGSVSMPKTPLEWANLRPAGRVPSRFLAACACVCVCERAHACRQGGNRGGWGLGEDP